MASRATTVLFILSSMLLVSTAMAYSSNYLDSTGVFAANFFKEAVNQPKNKGRDVISSSLSADIVMSMVAFGAEQETRKEIIDVLDIEDINAIKPQIQNILQDLNKKSEVELVLANKVYFKPSAGGKLDAVAPSYLEVIEDTFGSEVEQLDFSKSQVAADVINGWVEGKTNHRIKNLVPTSSLSDATSAVLVNAIYFKGAWQTPFDPYLTTKADFTRTDGSIAEVDMMRLLGNFGYAEVEDLDAKVVALPYKEQDAAMVIILPNKPAGIDELQDKIKGDFNKYKVLLTIQPVRLSLPKFKIESTIDVKNAFQNLGCNRVFSDDAQLTKIMKTPENLSITEAIQKATIEVNEAGSEAAAATYAIAGRRSGRVDPPVVFDANHPFLFGIVKGPRVEIFRGSFRGSK